MSDEMKDATPGSSVIREKMTPIAQRYHGAWLEYNTRIQARTSLTNTFLTVSLALLSALYGDIPRKIAAAESRDDFTKMLAFSMPLASLIFATLLLMHDGMMGCLANYMKTCELEGDPDATVPAYHVDGFWCKRFVIWRSLQQLAAAIVIVIFCIAASHRVGAMLSPIEGVAYYFILLASLILTMISPILRKHWMERVWNAPNR